MNRKTFERALRRHYRAKVPMSIPSRVMPQPLDDVARDPSDARPAKRFAFKFAIVGLFAAVTLLFVLGHGPATPIVFAEVDDVYAFQAVSATDLLFQTRPETTPLAWPLSNAEPKVSSQLEVLNRYLNVMEGFLGNETLLSARLEPSDRPEYAWKLNYDSVDLLGAPITYTLYYSEREVAADDPFAFEDEDDEHAVSHLVGEMTFGATVYRLEGKKLVDGDEEVLVLRSYVDALNYVVVRYETDDDGERKFFYSVVVDGIFVDRAKLKVETDDGRIVSELSFIEGTARGTYVFRETTVGGVECIDVDYEIDDETGPESGRILITPVTDTVTGIVSYSYSVRTDDSEIRYEYERRDEDDEDDGGDDDEGDDNGDDEEDHENEDIEDDEDDSEDVADE